MSDDRSALWLTLDLDPGTAGFLGLPPRLPIPYSHAAPILETPRPTLEALAAGLEAALARDPDLAADPALLRFLRRWPRYADLERYLRMGNATFATAIAQSLRADDPADPPPTGALALLAAQEGRWDEALALLVPLRERVPEHAATRLQFALVLAGAGRRKESLEELEQLLSSRAQSLARLWLYEIRNGDADTLSARLRESFHNPPGEGDAPEEIWGRLEAAFPDNPEVLFAIAQDPRRGEDSGAREARLCRVLAGDPDHGPAVAALSSMLRATGRSERALELLAEFTARRPGDRMGLAALGETLEAVGRGPDAREAYEAVLAAPWTTLPMEALLAAGHGLLRTGDSGGLRYTLQAIVEARPREPAAHQMLARVIEGAGEPEAAERALRDGMKACGPRPNLVFALGDLLRRLDRRHEAEGLMKALVERHPAAPWGHRGLGDLHLESNPARALEHYGRALERDPGTPIPGLEYLRGVHALREGRIEEACRHLERSVALDPASARAWCDLGAAYFHANRVDDAIRATERALALAPGRPGFLHNLAVYHAARFRGRPWRHPASAWHAWRLRRLAEHGGDAAWRRGLWNPAGGEADGSGDAATEARPDA